MMANQHSSQQNRRLAQQMANRPAVQAALGNQGGAGPAVPVIQRQRKPQVIVGRCCNSNYQFYFYCKVENVEPIECLRTVS